MHGDVDGRAAEFTIPALTSDLLDSHEPQSLLLPVASPVHDSRTIGERGPPRVLDPQDSFTE